MVRRAVSWASDELIESLAQLSAQQAAGVVRIVQAELEGQPLSSLLDCRGQICTSTTYYGSGKRRGWKGKIEFQTALSLAKRDYRAWWLEHGTAEALQILASATPSAARALKHQVAGDSAAIAALVEMLSAEDETERLVASEGLAATGLPVVVPFLARALAEEQDTAIRKVLIMGLAAIAGFRDGDRRLSAEAVLDRADVKTAIKQAREIDENILDAEIERRLAAMVAGGENEVIGASAGDADRAGD